MLEFFYDYAVGKGIKFGFAKHRCPPANSFQKRLTLNSKEV